jgi:hypothetical protein
MDLMISTGESENICYYYYYEYLLVISTYSNIYINESKLVIIYLSPINI